MKSNERQGEHPTIEVGSPDFHLWEEYFDRHLGGRPLAFRLLVDKAVLHMTVPEPVPMWFDPSFEPRQGATVNKIMLESGGRRYGD